MTKPSLQQLEAALDERIAIGDLTGLVSEKVPDPIQYIGYMATAISEAASVNEKLQPAPGVVRIEGTDELIEGDA